MVCPTCHTSTPDTLPLCQQCGAPLPALPPPPAQPEMRLNIGYLSDVGQTRSVNEDSLLVLQFTALCETRGTPQICFLAVADGIGGQEAGEVASRTAVHYLASDLFQNLFALAMAKPLLTLEDLKEQLVAAVYATNMHLAEMRRVKQSDMGCTLTAALVYGAQVLVVNLGDSRTYWLEQGQLRQVTRDHSLVASLISAGLAQPDDVYTHQHKSVIYRSLGYQTDLEIDLFYLALQPGDRLVLCSDGLWEMVRDPELEAVLNSNPDPQAACQHLVRLANRHGGPDNISVIVANAEPLNAPAPPGP